MAKPAKGNKGKEKEQRTYNNVKIPVSGALHGNLGSDPTIDTEKGWVTYSVAVSYYDFVAKENKTVWFKIIRKNERNADHRLRKGMKIFFSFDAIDVSPYLKKENGEATVSFTIWFPKVDYLSKLTEESDYDDGDAGDNIDEIEEYEDEDEIEEDEDEDEDSSESLEDLFD